MRFLIDTQVTCYLLPQDGLMAKQPSGAGDPVNQIIHFPSCS